MISIMTFGWRKKNELSKLTADHKAEAARVAEEHCTAMEKESEEHEEVDTRMTKEHGVVATKMIEEHEAEVIDVEAVAVKAKEQHKADHHQDC